jgi:hypothetical protein
MFKVDFRRKHVFVALAILLSLAVVYRFFPFFQEVCSPNQEIELMEKRLVKYQEMIDFGKNINKRLDSLNKTTKEVESRLLAGKTPSLAAVEVQKIMQETAGRSNVQINSVKMLKPEELDKHGYLRVPVEFQILPTIKQLKEILYQLEASQKCLTVRKIVVTEYNNRDRQLRCNITVAGLMKRAEN